MFFALKALAHANKPAVAVNATHIKRINKLMYATTISYIKCFATGRDADTSMYAMYAQDVAYNTNALAQFNNTLNAQELHNAIMQQANAELRQIGHPSGPNDSPACGSSTPWYRSFWLLR